MVLLTAAILILPMAPWPRSRQGGGALEGAPGRGVEGGQTQPRENNYVCYATPWLFCDLTCCFQLIEVMPHVIFQQTNHQKAR